MARMCCYPWNCWQEVEKGISSRKPNSFIFILILPLQTCSVFSLGVTIVMILTIKARGDFAVFFIDVAKYTGKIAAFRRKGCKIFLAWGLNFGVIWGATKLLHNKFVAAPNMKPNWQYRLSFNLRASFKVTMFRNIYCWSLVCSWKPIYPRPPQSFLPHIQH